MAERINLRSFRKEVDSTYVGFTPNGGSIKPVHVANGVQRCIFGGFNTTMQIKKLALVADAKGNVPAGSDLETIYSTLVENETIEDGISQGSVESMRNIMQRLLSADKGVYVVRGLKDSMISFTAGSKYFLTGASIYEDTGEFIGGLIRSYCPELAEYIKELLDKAKDGVHSINMSATPIPRSLAVALSSQSTKIIDIKTMPAGRKPVQTILYGNEEKTFEAMYRQIRLGHQCYIVCPLIESKSDAEIDSVETTLKKATAYFEKYHPKEVNVAAITGKTGKKKQQEIISSFAAQQIDILIATTVVEVGVNVPNATVMVIKNAERFGLAQLHQLRGRVGRSSAQSYCVLLSHDKQNKRLLTMVQTTDGFEIAKADLEQRGAGDILGTEQSGFNAVLACVSTHRALYQSILEEAGKTF